MAAKTELLEAQEAMAAVLDSKLSSLPEWRAYRAIQRALAAEDGEANGAAKERVWTHRPGQDPSYTFLTNAALAERGKPIPTPALMDFIGKNRKLDSDPERAKINVISSLSKSPLFTSVPWEGGRAWWYADRAVPK